MKVVSTEVNSLYFQNEDFLMMGKLIATSVVQGGPGLPVLIPAVYRYIATSSYSPEWMPGITDFPDPFIRNLLQQVKSKLTQYRTGPIAGG